MLLKIENSEKKVIIDDDFSFLKQYKWYLNSLGYVRATINKKRHFIHRVIMKAQKGQMIDHINRNPLDNKLSNLRFTTTQGNIANSVGFPRRRIYSKYKGITYDIDPKRKTKKWVAGLEVLGKRHTIRTETEKEAVDFYNKKAKEIWGEFSFLNKWEGETQWSPAYKNEKVIKNV